MKTKILNFIKKYWRVGWYSFLILAVISNCEQKEEQRSLIIEYIKNHQYSKGYIDGVNDCQEDCQTWK